MKEQKGNYQSLIKERGVIPQEIKFTHIPEKFINPYHNIDIKLPIKFAISINNALKANSCK